MFKADLDAPAFRDAVMAFMQNWLARGGDVWTFIGRTPHGEIPVGIALMSVDGGYAEPHAIWFAEASGRNRLELALSFLIEQKRHYKLLLWVRVTDWKLYDHLCKYGVIRTVGKYRGYFPDGEDGFLFQGVRA